MGRVEVSYQGAWATVPDRMYSTVNFDDKAAKVVCRMLGYPTYVFMFFKIFKCMYLRFPIDFSMIIGVRVKRPKQHPLYIMCPYLSSDNDICHYSILKHSMLETLFDRFYSFRDVVRLQCQLH